MSINYCINNRTYTKFCGTRKCVILIMIFRDSCPGNEEKVSVNGFRPCELAKCNSA